MTEKTDQNRQAESSASHPGYSLYWIILLVVFVLTSVGGHALYPDSFPMVSAVVAAVFVLLGLLRYGTDLWFRGKYGVLADYAITMGVRTGVPLLAVLVFFLSFDNILSKRCVLTLALFYLFLFPAEVWTSLPRPRVQTDQREIPPQEQTDKQENEQHGD